MNLPENHFYRGGGYQKDVRHRLRLQQGQHIHQKYREQGIHLYTVMHIFVLPTYCRDADFCAADIKPCAENDK